MPFVAIAQVWYAPASSFVKVPAGMPVSWLRLLLPQQASVPSVLMPQVWSEPALMAVNVVAAGGRLLVSWPLPSPPPQCKGCS